MQTHPFRGGFKVVVAVAILLLLSLPFLLPPDGHTHGRWEQFLGRFHPLAIHVPISLLLLVPLLELFGRSRSALRETAGFLLPWAAGSAVGTAVLGILLAHGGGFAREAVQWHMWSAIALAMTAILCTVLRPAWQAAPGSGFYPASLVLLVLLTVWTGHQGGSITYGKGYLSQLAPSLLPHLPSRGSYPPVNPASVYATRIQPILNAKCVSCHGPAKRKGGLELDSYAHVMDGGNSGAVIAEGHPETSVLYERITLPRSDRKAMPGDGKPPLAPAEIAAIKGWIEQGASPLAAPVSGPPSQGR